MMFENFKFFHGTTFLLESINIEGAIRTLRATWEQDINFEIHTYQGIDAEAELTRLLSMQIANEIDNEIMDALMNDVMSIDVLYFKFFE